MLSLHEILRERRQELGATRAQVSLWSGLPESHIEAIESGERNLTPWEFERISLGLGIDPGSLFSKQEQPPKRSTARFRVATGVDNPASQDLRLLGTASEFGRVLGYLARLLDIQPRLQPLRSVKQAPGWDVWQQGYDLGEQARAAMCDDSGPVLRLEATFSDWQIHVQQSVFPHRKLMRHRSGNRRLFLSSYSMKLLHGSNTRPLVEPHWHMSSVIFSTMRIHLKTS